MDSVSFVAIPTDHSVYGREIKWGLSPKEIPPLQSLCCDSIVSSLQLNQQQLQLQQSQPQFQTSQSTLATQQEHEGYLIELITSLLNYNLNNSIVERLFFNLMSSQLMTPKLFSIFHFSTNMITYDFSSLDLTFTSKDFFDCLWDNNYNDTFTLKQLIFNEINEAIIEMFLKCSVYKPFNLSHILHISITNSEEMNDTVVFTISQSFPNLEVLNVSNCRWLTELSIHSISSSVFTNTLTSLNLSHNQADKASLESLTSLTKLTYLNLSFLQKLMDSFTLNLSHLNQLQSLNLSSLHELNDQGYEVMLYQSGLLYHSLKSLYITESTLSDESFQRIFCSSPFLDTQTSLSTLYSMISKTSFQLITLDLSWCDNITASSLSKAIQNCPLLQYLYLRSTSTDVDTVLTISKSCPHLIELYISRCNDLNDICLKELSLLQFLTSLDISWASIQSYSTIEFLCESKSIEKLCLQGCKGLQSEIIDCLLNGAAMNLKYLDLGWVNMFSSTMAEELSLKRKDMIIVDYYMQVYVGGEVVAERI